MPREELKSRLEVATRLFNGMIRHMVAGKALLETGHLIALATHEIRFDAQQRSQIDHLMRKFTASPYAPPSFTECADIVGEEIVAALIASGQLISVSAEVVFRKGDYDSMVTKVRGVLEDKGQITLAEARDLFQTSRKFAQALLEHLDANGTTRRTGEVRVLIH
jgi:selenocysteine-specific elongation factor